MKTQEIREKFTQFFEKHSHEKISSSPLIPIDDPTLLFANAGMNQFKDYFTGKANPKNKRATTIQKVVRAGGKHNDLENVGFTARHHTFFEMLGNFSFGDYFKSEAIDFAWKFLTEELNIPKDKLYITVHDSDDEAANIWHKEQGIPKNRIFRMGDKDNFWEMGDIGPCGPCSEIFYDHGPNFSDPNYDEQTADNILADEMRYVEIWNLVFMQYEKFKDSQGAIQRRELPAPSVDTGAGLERIAAALQGKYWNYDSDGFRPIFDKLEELSGKKYGSNDKVNGPMRVVADHARSCTMLITDGAIPSNEGRGYVLRRIIRRAIRNLRELEIKDVSFYKLVPVVLETLGKEYPENAANGALAEKLLKLEEEKFLETLDTGLKFLNEAIEKDLKEKTLPGEIAFKLYDTFGFPQDLTEVILRERSLEVDTEGFERAMEKQRAQSKKASKFEAGNDNKETFYKYVENNGQTQFLGYENLSAEAKLLGIETLGEYSALIFDKTPFYGESGGQVGDIGFIKDSQGNKLSTILDTQKPVDGLHVHYTKEATALKAGESYTLVIDQQTRNKTIRNHSATHLLQAALIEVLGDHIKQAGSYCGPDRLRFDFTHPEAVSKEQIAEVEAIVNNQISNSLTVTPEVMSKDAAMEKGAMALFGEKYGDKVRVLTMGDFSTELCGGTHVNSTEEIGLFSIISESSLSSGVRRIEALTSTTAFERLNQRSGLLNQVERLFSTKEEKILDKINSLISEIKEKNKSISQLQDKLQELQSNDLFNDIQKIGNYSFVSIEAPENSDLRKLSDSFVAKNQNGIILARAQKGPKLAVLLRRHKDIKDLNCSNILKETLPMLNGRGGGKPDMAQGSAELGTDYSSFDNKVKNLIQGE